jgi:uncharacterized protein (TIGR03435 family)
VVAAAAVLAAQAPPAFEVASIKRNVSGAEGAQLRGLPGGRMAITNYTLRDIVRNAYFLQNFQISGGPEWMNNDRWDIVAKAEATDVPPQSMMLMLRTLLADRFKLVVHTERRDSPVFALVLARSDGRLGSQLRPSSVDCAALIAAAQARRERVPDQPGGRPGCGTRMTAGKMMATATTMADVARNMTPVAGRTIIDKTGLTGNFDLDLSWAPDPQPSADGIRPQSDVPSLFTAVQEQLGLKLESQRAPVETLVIDSVERPTED